MSPGPRSVSAVPVRFRMTMAGWAFLIVSLTTFWAAVYTMAALVLLLSVAMLVGHLLIILIALRYSVHFWLTKAGWAFLVVSLLVCAAAINQQVALLFLLFGAMMGALCVSLLIALRYVMAADLRRDVPSRVWQHQTVHLGYYLSNRQRTGALLGLEVREVAPLGVQVAPAYCVHVGGRAVFRAGGRFAARLRGRIHMDLVRIGTAFPFGLLVAWKAFLRPADVVIWPARGRLKIRLLHWGAVETSRAAPSPATGGQDEFFGLREYRSGDNPRWIHWRRSALRTTPVVREMARPLPEVLVVILDTFCASPGPADSTSPSGAGFAEPGAAIREKMVRFAGTLIDHALGRGYLVGLALAYSERVVVYRPAPGRGQLCALLDALADIDANSSRRIDETLGHVEPGAVRSAIVAAVSLDGDWRPGGHGKPVPFGCRRLLVINPRNIDDAFEDDPLATAEASPCP